LKHAIWRHVLLGVSLVFAIFHLVLPVYGFLPALQARAVHIGLAFVIIFFGGLVNAKAAVSPWRRAADLALTAVGVGITAYVILQYDQISNQYGVPTGSGQVIMAFVLMLLILEAARRMIRPTLPIIASVFLLYAVFGHLIPGPFGHPKYTFETIAGQMFLTTGGIWGLLVGVSTNVIAIFVFFGAFIFATGGGSGFMKLSIKLAGRFTGGPAKVATISSALFGSVSGSASANVATTGSFSIPMMKRLKYKPEMAAAVEAVASTGGQIMPPIMGAGAFVMAELTETPYLKVAYHALIPAALYFLAAGIGVHLYSRREGYVGLSRAEIPSWNSTLTAAGFFLIPFAVLLGWMISGYTPQYSAFWATMATIPLGLLNEDWRFDFSGALGRFKEAVSTGARQGALIASITASAQIIIAIVGLTGLGVKVSSGILSFGEGRLLLTLILIAFTSVFLGMGVPTTAAYIMAVVIGGPVLIEFGIPPIAVHLFVFYFAILSAVTPPICGAVFIAAGMAEADWIKTAKVALKLSFAAFLVPFLFVYDGGLLLLESGMENAISIARAGVGVVLLSGAFMNYWGKRLGLPRRTLLALAGALALVPLPIANLGGILLAAVVFVI
jgi:TRAP transporter 4TM/12TM fusion protein